MHRDFEHIGEVIRQKYSPDYQPTRMQERRSRVLNCIIVVACIAMLVATPAAIYLLANDKPLYGLAALVTALGAAFGPKIYADFIQPKASLPTREDY